MPDGPKRAPGLYEVPVSNGAPGLTSYHQPLTFLLQLLWSFRLTQEGNIEFLDIGREAWPIWEPAESRYS